MKGAVVTANAFLEGFRNAWLNRTSDEDGRKAVEELYTSNTAWTKYMLDAQSGLLSDVAHHVRQDSGLNDLKYYGASLYTVDALFVGGADTTDLIGRKDGGYPDKLYALVEHENDKAVEEEMWKLLWWRCPLKVIIFYDWMKSERDRAEARRRWLDEKLEQFRSMWNRVDSFCSEDPRTEYLFIIGDRQTPAAFPQWRALTFSKGAQQHNEPVHLC